MFFFIYFIFFSPNGYRWPGIIYRLKKLVTKLLGDGGLPPPTRAIPGLDHSNNSVFNHVRDTSHAIDLENSKMDFSSN